MLALSPRKAEQDILRSYSSALLASSRLVPSPHAVCVVQVSILSHLVLLFLQAMVGSSPFFPSSLPHIPAVGLSWQPWLEGQEELLTTPATLLMCFQPGWLELDTLE